MVHADIVRYKAFQSAALTDATPAASVPVPSHLYYKRTVEQLFAGHRVAVKDNMHFAGTVTGLGSRSYAELYCTKDITSEYVLALERKGAVIVGKTKLSAFAGSEVLQINALTIFRHGTHEAMATREVRVVRAQRSPVIR